MFRSTTPRTAQKTLRVLAMLLEYPDAALRAHCSEMREAIHTEAALTPARLAELDALIDALMCRDALDVEADYVALFDRGRSTSLHLFEHVHGDSRERGAAMVDLAQTYEKAGLYLREGELPDYLPVVLQFVSTQPPREAQAFLQETVHILNALFGALQERRTRYASVIGALIEIAGESAQPIKPAAEEALDESWAEPPVFNGCSTRGQSRPGEPQPIRIVRQPNAAQGVRP